MSDETHCKYVSSRGILKSCSSHSLTPMSSIQQVIDQDFSQLRDGDSIYVPSSAIFDFVVNILPNLKTRFVLVSGDCDNSVPVQSLPEDMFREFINSPKLIAWFSQNLIIPRGMIPKLHHMPIGMDYHTMSQSEMWWGRQATPVIQEEMLIGLAERAKPFYARRPIAYTTFHFTLHRGCRQEAYDSIPKELVVYEETPKPRIFSWREQTKYAFVISPPGEGLDCHRTWEALCLGCIPIVRKNGISPIYEGLPVLEVEKWSDITEELLKTTLEKFKWMEFEMERLTLKYWMDKIQKAGKDAIAGMKAEERPETDEEAEQYATIL